MTDSVNDTVDDLANNLGVQYKDIKYLERRAIIPAKLGASTSRTSNGLTAPLPDLDNVQGDIYYMFPKRFEQFIFFTISNLDQFRQALNTYLPKVTSSSQTIANINQINDKPKGGLDIVSSQIAFSRAGLKCLNPDEGICLRDPHFDNGPMEDEKSILGDMAEWDDVFRGGRIHGVILVTAGTKMTCDNEGDSIRKIFSGSIKDAGTTTMDGRVRAGDGEHFGWRDGISQPALDGLSQPHPGQRVVSPGVIIMGYPGDPVIDNPKSIQRPGYTKDGSFMVFRKLEQAVLKLEDYIDKSYVSISPSEPNDGRELTTAQRKDLFGARMVGRFKKGAPLALTPYRDNATYRQPSWINNFDYTTGGHPPSCPFAAHIRKMAPRNLDPLIQKQYLDAAVIVRSGIPYGDDVTQKERSDWKKLTDEQKAKQKSPRGLLFVCYQSSIHNGYFLQTTGFGNNSFFPTTSIVPQKHGQDPIIGGGPKPISIVDGQAAIPSEGEVTLILADQNSKKYMVTGFAKAMDDSEIAFTQDFFVTSRGGEYFFVPSISTLAKWGASQT